MEITRNKLVDILCEAFDRGYVGDCECKEAVNNILNQHKIIKPEKEEDEEEYRIFQLEELRNLPTGTKLFHQLLGKCRVHRNDKGVGCLVFDNPALTPAWFNTFSYPFDIHMKKI